MRQLVAILFTDMVGYSRQMDADESAALRRLDIHNSLMRESIARHDGTEIKTVGDAFVVTFQSAVSAVECALDAQRALELHNSMVAESERILVRMGIHAGDAVLRDGDLFGEAVNIAARLEPHAPPGGICISRTVLEQVRRKVRASIVPLGDVALKNISEPMALYAVRPGDEMIGEVTGTRSVTAAKPRSIPRRVIVAGLTGVAALAAAAGVRRFGIRRGTAPHRGGVLRIASAKPDAPLDPYTSADTRGRDILSLVCEPLTSADPARPGGVVGTTRMLDGGRAVELVLRPGLWFHDHPCFPDGRGRKADAQDAAFSVATAARFDEAFTLAIRGRTAPGSMPPGIVVVSADTLRLELDSPSSNVVEELATVVMLPRELEAAEPDIRRLRRPVGTGPFRFTGQPESARIVLERAPRYWGVGEDGEPLPYLDRIEVAGGDDYRSMFKRLRAAEIDVAFPSPLDQPRFLATGGRPRLVEDFKDLPVTVGVSTSHGEYRLYGLKIIERPGALADRRVRRAVARSLDRNAIVKGSEFASPAARIFRDDLLGYDASFAGIPYDTAEAGTLLAEAGYPRGRGLPELVLAALGHPPADEAVAACLRAAGFQVRLTPITSAVFEAVRLDRSADGILTRFTTSAADGELPAGVLAFPGWGYPNDRLAVLMKELDTTRSRWDRVPIYSKIEREFLNDPPFIPIAWSPRDEVTWTIVVRPEVRGMVDPVTGSAEGFSSFARAWLAPGP